MIYDIFYVSESTVNENRWNDFRSRFSTAQKIENVKSLEDISKKSFTKFYWVVWDNIVVLDNFLFDYRVNKWEEEYIHVFKNACNEKTSYRNSIALFPKSIKVSKKEFDHKFYIHKKEIDQIASRFQYPKYTFESYEHYLEVCKKETSPLFWSVPHDIEIIKPDVFDLYFDPFDGEFDYDRNENHVFLNDKFYDGIFLLSKSKILSEKEFRYRFPVDKKEWKLTVSRPMPYDIIFISYYEVNADNNFQQLQNRFPKAKRIQGVRGIHQAHIEAAKIADTEMFWVVDADAIIVDDFNFEIEYFPYYDPGNRLQHLSTVYVWTSKNPINDLEYGYGGVKLLPRAKVLEMTDFSVDMTTSLSDKVKVIPTVSNLTNFNIDPFSTWRSAFRECVKLSSKVIDRNYDEETEERLRIWCTVGKDRQYGEYSISGANAGRRFGQANINNKVELSRINDFDWLKRKFEEIHG